MVSNDMPKNQPIQIKCYKEQDRLVIRISTSVKGDLASVRKVFLDLAEGRIKEFDLCSMEGVVAVGVKSLTLQLVPSRAVHKALQLVGDSIDGFEFYWSTSTEGWADYAWLLKGLLEDKQSGHQYFDYDTVDDDATIVIAFDEDS